jgi:HSP20 family protein
MNVQTTPSAAPARGIAPFFAPLQREFDRMRAEFGGFDLAEAFGPSPRMDMRETEDRVELTVELPGLSEKDVRVEFRDDVLTVSGEKKSTSESEEKGVRMLERRYGAFSRSVSLPAGVKAEEIKATLKDGVLTVVAPFDPAAGGRKVEVQVKSA